MIIIIDKRMFLWYIVITKRKAYTKPNRNEYPQFKIYFTTERNIIMKKELVNLSNQYLANIGVSYIKLHNLHWNVVGKQFKAVHEYLESLYDALADVLDEVAEILKMNGEMPLGSLKDYLAVASVQELDNKELSVNESLEIVLADLQLLKAQAEEIRRMADEEDHYQLVGSMEDQLSNYSKNIWFIKAMLK